MLLIHSTTERRASRRRRTIASGLENAVARAAESGRPPSVEVPLDRAAVTACADRLLTLATVLRSDRELPDEGVAAARRLMIDGGGPLYADGVGSLPHALTRVEIALGLR